jgi:hypothetical protein
MKKWGEYRQYSLEGERQKYFLYTQARASGIGASERGEILGSKKMEDFIMSRENALSSKQGLYCFRSEF